MRSPNLKASVLQLSILERISRQVTSSIREVERSQLILALLAGYSNSRVEQELGYTWEKAKRWRYRWLTIQPGVDQLEAISTPKQVRWEVEKAIRQALSDAPRPGSPAKFSAHDYCQILGVALEAPLLSGRPISEWSLTELKQEVEKRGIVSSISRSQVGSFLKRERGQTPQDSGLAHPPL